MSTFLIVEDEEDVKDVCVEALQLFGHEAVVYPNAQEAMDALAKGEISLDQKADGIAGAIIDFQNKGPKTPNSGGGELAEYLQEVYPAFPFRIMTGDAFQFRKEYPGLQVRVLAKPIRPPELRKALDDMLASRTQTLCAPKTGVVSSVNYEGKRQSVLDNRGISLVDTQVIRLG